MSQFFPQVPPNPDLLFKFRILDRPKILSNAYNVLKGTKNIILKTMHTFLQLADTTLG